MNLIPQPLGIEQREGRFVIDNSSRIVLCAAGSSKCLKACIQLKEKIKQLTGISLAISKAFQRDKGDIYIRREYAKAEGYEIRVSEEGIDINGGDDAGVFYGTMTLCQIISQQGLSIPYLTIKDEPYFKYRGFYHDITRGKVPTLDTLKDLVDRLAYYKINQLQLYIEHTFAFKEFSEVWIGKDPITAEEILLLDEYCKERYIELVPSLSTFGHLYEVLRSKSYSELCELDESEPQPFSWINRMKHHTLDVSNEGSIKLVENMLKEFIPLFSSNKFNICCDETFDLGKGKNKDKAADIGSGRLYVDFLNKVINCAKGYNKVVMFWGDIILNHPELLKDIPKDVTCLNWYYWDKPKEEDTKAIQESGMPQYVCPGVTGWNRIMNDMDMASTNIKKMVKLGKQYGAIGVLNTDWGDYGHINLLANSIPGMIYGAALAWNPEDMRDNHQLDRIISKLEFGDHTESIVVVLRKLSQLEKATWWHVVYWLESRKLKDEELIALVNNFPKPGNNELQVGYTGALQIERELYRYFGNIPMDRLQDLREFIVSAKGVALMNAFMLVLKRYEFKENNTTLALEPKQLAKEIEGWFYDYEKVWRERNKESELYRIREAIQYICSYLRDI